MGKISEEMVMRMRLLVALCLLHLSLSGVEGFEPEYDDSMSTPSPSDRTMVADGPAVSNTKRTSYSRSVPPMSENQAPPEDGAAVDEAAHSDGPAAVDEQTDPVDEAAHSDGPAADNTPVAEIPPDNAPVNEVTADVNSPVQVDAAVDSSNNDGPVS